MSFAAGDRVAWDHGYATDHADGSVVRAEAVAAKAPQALFGTVQDPAPSNPEGTYYHVLLDGAQEPKELTSDELVKVSGDPPAPEAAPEAPAEPAPDPAPEAPAA